MACWKMSVPLPALQHHFQQHNGLLASRHKFPQDDHQGLSKRLSRFYGQAGQHCLPDLQPKDAP